MTESGDPVATDPSTDVDPEIVDQWSDGRIPHCARPRRRSAVGQSLRRRLRRVRGLATGFLSTGLLLPVLCDAGYHELAYRLLVRTRFPSWMGMLEADPTHVEWWDGLPADGTA